MQNPTTLLWSEAGHFGLDNEPLRARYSAGWEQAPLLTPVGGCERLLASTAYHTLSSLSRLNFAKCPIAPPDTIT